MAIDHTAESGRTCDLNKPVVAALLVNNKTKVPQNFESRVEVAISTRQIALSCESNFAFRLSF